jgi:hypothetical protein
MLERLRGITECLLVKAIQMVNIVAVIVSNSELVLREMPKGPRNTTNCLLINLLNRGARDTHAAQKPMKVSKRSLFLLHFAR